MTQTVVNYIYCIKNTTVYTMESYTTTSKPSTNTSTCDTPSIKVTIREVIWSHFIKILKNVSCDYDGWVVETQLCKLRDTEDTLIGRACKYIYLPFVSYQKETKKKRA